MEVKFGNDPVSLVGFVTSKTAKKPLDLEWVANPESLYTAIIYDLDAPYPKNRSNSPYLHLLITNVKGMDLESGDSLIKYKSPSPPKNSLPHTFNADIYLQKNIIHPSVQTKRKKFNLNKFVTDNDLTLFNRFSFKVGELISTKPQTYKGSSTMIPVSKSIPKTIIFFKPDSDLSEKKRKWCRCMIKVADKQKGRCNVEQAWFESRDGTKCYSPYRVCSASVGTSSRECGKHFDFDSFSDNHLIAYAELHQKDKDGIIIKIPKPYNRSQMLTNIKTWKQMKSK